MYRLNPQAVHNFKYSEEISYVQSCYITSITHISKIIMYQQLVHQTINPIVKINNIPHHVNSTITF